MKKIVLTLIVIGALLLSAMMIGAPADSPVADAARRGDKDAVRSLLQKGADVNAALSDGMTALHWAAEHNDAELAEMLLYAGANPKAVTRIGQYTPLHVASKEGNAAVVKMLLKAGGDVNGKTSVSGVTPLHLAAASGNVDTVNALLENKADVNAREAEWEQTPLIFAAAQNRAAVIQTLIKGGANPNLSSKAVDIVADQKLAAAAAAREKQVISSFAKKEGEFPSAAEVQAAVIAGREILVSKTIPKDLADAAANGRGGRGGGGAAAAAAAGGFVDNRVPRVTSKGGLTPLLHASRQGYIESVAALLDGGADINKPAGDGTTPLLMSIINAQFDVAMILTKRGANPNKPAFNGVTPLWAAVNAEWQPRTRFPQPQEHGLQNATYFDVMEALLNSGANPNARVTLHPWYMEYTGCGNGNCGLEEMEGSTAFWRAAYGTDVDAMRLLVRRGADPNITTLAPPPRGPRSGVALEKVDNEPAEMTIQPVAPGLWPATDASTIGPDPSGLQPVPAGGPGIYPLHAATGVGYGEGFAGNAHRHAPDAWLAAAKYIIEELHFDVNARDFNGYTALHHAAARGDDELILYLVSKGGDVTAVARTGQTVADMANSPVSRVSPFPATVALLEKLGSKNNHRCVAC